MGLASQQKHGISVLSAVVAISKAMIGAGILALPYAFSRVRLAFGLIAIPVIGFLSGFAIWRLVQCKVQLSKRKVDALAQSDTEAERADESKDYGLGLLVKMSSKLYGVPGAAVATVAVIASQIGATMCYTNMTATITYDLLEGSISLPLIRVSFCILFCALSLARELRELAWLSAIALLTYCYLFFVLVKNGVQFVNEGNPSGDFLPVRWEGVSMFYGSFIFAMEGVNIASVAFEDMQLSEPTPFLRALTYSYTICGAAYGFVGAFGYYFYGDSVQELIYNNFPDSSIDVALTKMVVCFVLTLSVNLQMYPVYVWMEASLFDEEAKQESCSEDESGLTQSDVSSCALWRSIGLRFTTLVFTCIIAAFIPDIARLMDVVGTFCLGTVGFVLPALLHIKAFHGEHSMASLGMDLVILFAGLIAMVLCLAKLMGV